MYAETLTVTGVARPEFALSLGLGRYFVNPTGALFNSLGNALSSAASSAWNGITNTGQRFANLVSGDGWNTNAQIDAMKAAAAIGGGGASVALAAFNNKYAEKLGGSQEHAYIANQLGGKLSNLDGDLVVQMPDGTIQPITNSDLVAANNALHTGDVELRKVGLRDFFAKFAPPSNDTAGTQAPGFLGTGTQAIPGFTPRFIDQHNLPVAPKVACNYNSLRTELEAIEGRPAPADFVQRALANGGIDANGKVLDYNKVAEAFGSTARWQTSDSKNTAGKKWAFGSVADDTPGWQQRIDQMLKDGHYPVIRVSGHSMNIVGKEIINGKELYRVWDQNDPSPNGSGWTHVDPNTQASRNDTDGSHGSQDKGWQMLHLDKKKNELFPRIERGGKPVMWGVGYYAK